MASAIISNEIRLINRVPSRAWMLDTRCGIRVQWQTDRACRIQNPVSLRLLRTRMKLPMHGFKPLLIDMRIDLRGGNIGVAQHFLDDPQISAVAKKVCRETVPEKVWVNIFLQAGATRVVFYNLPDTRCG